MENTLSIKNNKEKTFSLYITNKKGECTFAISDEGNVHTTINGKQVIVKSVKTLAKSFAESLKVIIENYNKSKNL